MSAAPWKSLDATNLSALDAAPHSSGHAAVQQVVHTTEEIVDEIKEKAHVLADRLGGVAAATTAAMGGILSKATGGASDATIPSVDATKTSSSAASSAADKAKDLGKKAVQLGKDARDKAGSYAKEASLKASEYTDKAKDSVSKLGTRVRDLTKGTTLRGWTLPLGIHLSPIATMLVGWGGLLGTQALFSLEPTKSKLSDLVGGPEALKGAYTIATAITAALLGRYYTKEGQFISIHCHDPVPYLPTILKMGAVLGISQALVNYAPSFASLQDGSVKWLDEPATVGVRRITRYPVLWALGAYGLAKGLEAGTVGPHLFFGLFPVYAWISGYLQDKREDKNVDDSSNLPFKAIGEGKQSLQAALQEINWPAALVGLLVNAKWLFPKLLK